MLTILVTGASGNVGRAVLAALAEPAGDDQVIAALRDPGNPPPGPEFAGRSLRALDFADATGYTAALQGVDVLFLLRPPQLADVPRYFAPLLRAARSQGIEKIVFLSVQGAPRSRLIPHHQIEKLIAEQGFDHVFLRPAYFMQNLISPLGDEIRNEGSITLPSGRAVFNWIDVADIGRVAAKVLTDFAAFRNQSFDLTGPENLNFGQVADLLSEIIETPIVYRSVNPLSFYRRQRRLGMEPGYARVITLLHFLPRLQSPPEITQSVASITEQMPSTLRQFITREAARFR